MSLPEPTRRRVLFVINDLRRAGAETQLVRLALGLDPMRYEARIVLLKVENHFAYELGEAGIGVEALHRHGPADLDVVRRLVRAIRRFDPDVVHSYLFLANLLTALAARRLRAPALVMAQRSCYESTLSPVWRWAARLSHRAADRVIVNSRAALAEELAAGLPQDLLVHIPNGIAVPVQPPAADRERLGLPRGPLVACVAQLSAEKGHDHLLAAWPEVVRRCPGSRLALIGDGPLRPALVEQARRSGVADRILFAGFQDPAPWLAAADLFVLPSITEGMPNAILEAMAWARPVVATRVGGVPELVEEGTTGLLVPPGDAAALATALSELLEDPVRRARLGQAGRARVAERFSIERLVEATEDVYARLPKRAATTRR